MTSRINTHWLLGVLAGLAILFNGCNTRPSTLQLNSNDVNALDQLREKSGWSFRHSQVGLKAYGDGALDIEITGEALQKGEDDDRSLLLPIVLTRELPSYYRVAEGSTPNTVELTAYQAKDGLWCIAAEVPLSQKQQSSPESNPPSERPTPSPSPSPLPSPSPSPNDSADTPSPQALAVKVRVLIVSPTFSTSLPLAIPASQNGAPVDTTVLLPNNARFETLEIGSDKQEQLTTLSVLPRSVAGNEVMAAGRLAPGVATWDFSRLAYTSTSSPNNSQSPWNIFRRRSFITYILLSAVGLCLYWIYEERKLRKAHQLSDLWGKLKTQAAELRREIEFQLKNKRLQTPELLVTAELLESDLNKRSHDRLNYAHEMKEDWKDARKHLVELKKAFEAAYKTAFSQPDLNIETYYAELKKLEGKANRLERNGEQVLRKLGIAFIRARFLLYLALLLAFIAFLFATTVATGQNVATSKQTQTPVNSTVLGDLGVEVKPEPGESDKVAVLLNFYPLSSAPAKDGKGEVIFGLGDNNKPELEKVTGTPEKLVEITQRSRKQATAKMKVNPFKKSDLLDAMSNPYVTNVRAPDQKFSTALGKSNLIGLECVIRNSQTLTNRNRWFHLFPFETISLQVPMALNIPAYLSNIDIQRPASDYEGDVIVEGLIDRYDDKGQRTFVENGQNYRLNRDVLTGNVNIPANTYFVIKADFHRYRGQKLFLTAGQLGIALIAGCVLGVVASRFRNTKVEYVVAAVGGLSLPFLQSQAVFAKYNSLPAVATGEGITIFELFFFASFIIYLGTAFGILLLVQKKKQKSSSGRWI